MAKDFINGKRTRFGNKRSHACEFITACLEILAKSSDLSRWQA